MSVDPQRLFTRVWEEVVKQDRVVCIEIIVAYRVYKVIVTFSVKGDPKVSWVRDKLIPLKRDRLTRRSGPERDR